MKPNTPPLLWVLFVEDDPTFSRLVTNFLTISSEAEFRVQNAISVYEAKQYLDNAHADIIILDLNVTDSYGYNTFQQLHEYAPNLPIVVLTGNSEAQIGRQTIANGAQDYLLKQDSTHPSFLARTLLYAFDRHNLQQEQKEAYQRRLHQLLIESDRLREMYSFVPNSGKSFRQIYPDQYEKVKQQYTRAWMQEMDGDTRVRSDILFAIATFFGDKGVSTTDVIELHIEVLEERQRILPKEKILTLLVESRFILVELMGYLIEYYRHSSTITEPNQATGLPEQTE